MGYLASGIHMRRLYTSPDTVLQVWCQDPSEVEVHTYWMSLVCDAAEIAKLSEYSRAPRSCELDTVLVSLHAAILAV